MPKLGAAATNVVLALCVAGLAASGAGCGDNVSGLTSAGGRGGGAAAGESGGGGKSSGGAGGGAGRGGAAGGVSGPGGAAGAAGAAGGAGSSVDAGGAGGGRSSCGSAALLCIPGAARCAGGAPQLCVVDDSHCPVWQAQPTCSANQTCDAATGACVCRDDPACGAPPTAGDFCPRAGASIHSTCVKQADGCFLVTNDVACDPGTTCNVTPPTTVVPMNTACGCPPAAADQTGVTAKLLGTGCQLADASAATRVGSASDDAVLVCAVMNGCPTWQLSVSCATQQLTGGADPVTNLPACVCRAPAKSGQYFVDPAPTMATFMTGEPTGAQFPAACRFRTLTTALGQTAPPPTEVIAEHESSSNVHFRTRTGTPGSLSCTAPNSCEGFPLEVPAGVHLYTSDVGSFNPAHYVIDVDETSSSSGVAVLLDDGAAFEGYTVDASGSDSRGLNAGLGVSAILASPAKGSWNSTPAVTPVAAAVNQVVLLGGVAPSAAATPVAQTALLVRGQAHWTATFLSIVGGERLTRGIQVDHSSDDVPGSTATLTVHHLNVLLRRATLPGQSFTDVAAIEIGIGGVGDPATADAGDVVTVTNDADDTAAGRGIMIDAGQGLGVYVRGGTATFNGVDVGNAMPGGAGEGFFAGFLVLGSNAPAARGLNINQGAVHGQTSSGVGVWSLGGLTTLDGVHLTAGGAGWRGVAIDPAVPGDPEGVAGDVTLTGTAATKTVLDSGALVNGTAMAGIVVGTGDESQPIRVSGIPPTSLPRLTIADHTTVRGFLDGLVINNGHVISSGSDVSFSGNWRDGVQILSSVTVAGTNPNDSLSRVVVTGASITGNGRLGVLVRDVAPVSLDQVKITGNGRPIAGSGLTFPDGTGGLDVQRSQITGNTAFLFTLSRSRVSDNAGCGITLSGGDDDLVNRASTTMGGTRLCGVGIGGGLSKNDAVPGPILSSPAAAPTGGFGGPTDVGGKVSATLRDNFVQDNTSVGIYVTEARDAEPTGGGVIDDVTEATIQGNVVTGNLTVVPATGSEPAAGGIYVAASDFTQIGCTGVGCTPELDTTLTADDVGCDDTASVSGGVKVHRSCTRVRMATFLGNTVACNGRGQLAFAVPQRSAMSASGAAWDIGSNAGVVGVTLADRCMMVATPNTLAGYSSVSLSEGIAIPGSATDPATLQSLIHVNAYGVFWNGPTLASGSDYSSSLAAAPQGNGDASGWGVCPGAIPVSCPVTVAP